MTPRTARTRTGLALIAALMVVSATGCGAATEQPNPAGTVVAPTSAAAPQSPKGIGPVDGDPGTTFVDSGPTSADSGTTFSTSASKGDLTTQPDPGSVIGVTAAAVVAGIGALLLLRRRRSPTFAAGSAHAPRLAQQDLTDPSTTSRAHEQDIAVLSHALREVATGAPSAAVAQQIERLLESGSSREELLLACIRYRDQLAERDPTSANRLLGALQQIGVDEIVVDGERFDAYRHEAIDRVVAPRRDLDDHVAETTRPGYRDHVRAVRLPQVVVYRSTFRDHNDPTVRDRPQ